MNEAWNLPSMNKESCRINGVLKFGMAFGNQRWLSEIVAMQCIKKQIQEGTYVRERERKRVRERQMKDNR